MAGESCHILYCLHLHASDRLKLARITARTAAEAAEKGGGGMTGEVLVAHNTEQVKMQIDEYRCTMKPVIDHYRYEVKRYHRVDCEGSLDDVKRDVMTLMQKLSVSLPPVFHSTCESNKTREKDRVFRASIAASQLRGDMTDALAFARAKAGALNNRGARRRLSAADKASAELESLIATHTSQEKRRESMGAVLGGFGANVSFGAKSGEGGGGFDAGMFTHNAVRDMVAEFQQKEAEAKAGGGRRRNRPRGGSGSGTEQDTEAGQKKKKTKRLLGDEGEYVAGVGVVDSAAAARVAVAHTLAALGSGRFRNEGWGEDAEVKRNAYIFVFAMPFYSYKNAAIILPRQARDTRWESSTQKQRDALFPCSGGPRRRNRNGSKRKRNVRRQRRRRGHVAAAAAAEAAGASAQIS